MSVDPIDTATWRNHTFDLVSRNVGIVTKADGF